MSPNLSPSLLGVDVGFSKVQKSTGIAVLYQDKLTLYRADSSWDDRKRLLPEGFCPTTVALDGPLLPGKADLRHVRAVEQLFIRGPFCRRCKPGLSHFGTGYSLRLAAIEAGHEFGKHFYGADYGLCNHFVEAFPNLFLGVMVSDSDYARMPALKRGQKFDWLYERALSKLKALADFVLLPAVVYDAVAEEDHELRAALVCLFTAALADCDQAIMAGDPDGGWFWLPPLALWEPWAWDAVAANLEGK